MKVKCIKEYNDLQKKRAVKVGEEFEVSAERAKILLSASVVEEVTAENSSDTAPKKKTPKKKEE